VCVCVCVLPGTRGFTANVIILEEAAYMPVALFKKVVVPAMGVNNTVVLAISTPDDEFNYFSQILELKDASDRPLFVTLKLGLACEACLAKGKPQDCVHKLAEQPPWKSTSRLRKIQAIMGDDSATFTRENQGIVISSRQFMFPVPWVVSFMQQERVQFEHNVPLIHMAIDPGGGGSLSDYAMSAITYFNEKTVVTHIHIHYSDR
jgi:hypothetical protein